ncbi:hypothetical protein MRS44_016055 [Fusarium solani]|uniref:uncharacterized protein n=1 Tax=Fusarium solani TaxID=169388 RepID=UPI0032C4B0F8|nr:hypothetical protein MRS44_016055 [Fusarium solani]
MNCKVQMSQHEEREKKIDQIEIRLSSIESLLRELSQRTISASGSHLQLLSAPQLLVPNVSRAISSGFTTAAPSTVHHESSDDESAFAGDSVLAVHTSYASELLENAIERTPIDHVNPEMREALSDLKQLIELQKRQSIGRGPRFPLQQHIPVGGLGQLPMPPMDIVVNLLNGIQG